MKRIAVTGEALFVHKPTGPRKEVLFVVSNRENGEPNDFTVYTYDDVAEYCEKNITSGDKVFVTGEFSFLLKNIDEIQQVHILADSVELLAKGEPVKKEKIKAGSGDMIKNLPVVDFDPEEVYENDIPDEELPFL